MDFKCSAEKKLVPLMIYQVKGIFEPLRTRSGLQNAEFIYTNLFPVN